MVVTHIRVRTIWLLILATIGICAAGLVGGQSKAATASCYSFAESDGEWITADSPQAVLSLLASRVDGMSRISGGEPGRIRESIRFQSIAAAAANPTREEPIRGGIRLVAETPSGELVGSFEMDQAGSRWRLARFVAAIPADFCSS